VRPESCRDTKWVFPFLLSSIYAGDFRQHLARR
jgi:hypothetical protein